MFFSAGLNLIMALNFSVVTWSVTMSVWGIASKAAMFLIGYAVMRTIGAARRGRRDVAGGHPIADDVVKAGIAS
jgi:hypothetical protein